MRLVIWVLALLFPLQSLASEKKALVGGHSLMASATRHWPTRLF